VLFDEMLSNGDNVGSDKRTKSTHLFVDIARRRLSDVLVLKVGIHGNVTLKSGKKRKLATILLSDAKLKVTFFHLLRLSQANIKEWTNFIHISRAVFAMIFS